jgi:hypothetical protein
LKTDLEALLDEKDIFWRQRARENWLKEGDCNTKFFHVCATQKRKAKMLHSIKDEAGRTLPRDYWRGFCGLFLVALHG